MNHLLTMQPPQPMQGVKAPTGVVGARWWKVALATVNEGLRAGIYDLGTTGPDRENDIRHEWTLQGIPALTFFSNAGFDEIGFHTFLWWVPGMTLDSWRSEVSARGWLERKDGKWLQGSGRLMKGGAGKRARDLDALRFERPLGYHPIGKTMM